ncbi:MAG: nucleotidyltransferase family protein [Nitrososphaerales archaeon]
MLSQKKAFEIASNYVNKLKEDYTLRLAALFGSFATNLWTESSDIDILIVADELSDNVWDNYVKLKERFIQPFGINTKTIQKEIESLNFIILDALEYGIILHKDQIVYNSIKEKFEHVKKRYNIVRTAKGWDYSKV